MLSDLDSYRRNIERLLSFPSTRLNRLQGSGTSGTSRNFVDPNVVRLLNHLERTTLTAFLSATTPTGLFAQTLYLWLLQAIATR